MFIRAKNLLRRFTPTSEMQLGSDGFVFVTETDTSALRDVAVGATVRGATAGPPWIVVNHTLANVSVLRWPGRLLRVAIVEKAGEQPLSYANYTRAVAVVVVEELPAPSLFGEHGPQLADLLDRISTLTLDEALALSANILPTSPEIYSAAWNNWLISADSNSDHLNENHGDTLQIRVESEVSPVGYALSLVSSMVLNQGRTVSGPAAIAVDADGEVELQAPWCGATRALLYATMAYGAPGLLTPEQATVLKFPWETVIKVPTGHR